MEREPNKQQSKKASPATSSASASAAASMAESKPGGEAKRMVGEKSDDDLLQQAKETTNKVFDQIQQQTNSRINRQKDEAAADLKKVADAVRQFGEGLAAEEQGLITQYAGEYGRKAAENIERLTNYLNANDAKRLISEVEKFGRRQPALLLGGAFLLGFAGARFLKSSAQLGGTTVDRRQLAAADTSQAITKSASA